MVDLMYVDFSDNRSLVETGLNAFVGEAVIGYAVYRTKWIDFNVIGGVRYATVEGKLEPSLFFRSNSPRERILLIRSWASGGNLNSGRNGIYPIILTSAVSA